jgi:hypothetical protein
MSGLYSQAGAVSGECCVRRWEGCAWNYATSLKTQAGERLHLLAELAGIEPG